MTAEKVLAQVDELEQLVIDATDGHGHIWPGAQLTNASLNALPALVALKRAAAEWAQRREEFRAGRLDSRTKLEDFIALEDRLAELALVLLEGA